MKSLLIAFVLGTVANAAVITEYSSLSAYQTAVGSIQTFTFLQPNNTAITNLGSILSVTTLGGDAQGLVDNSQLCGSSSGGIDCFKPLIFTFTQPSNAFGFDNGDLTTDEEAVVIFNFTNGDPSQQFTFDLNGAPAFTPTFFGATSDVNLSTVEVYSRTIGTTSIGDRANTVIDIEVPAAASTPEPSTLGTVAAGLLAGLAIFRRQSSSAKQA
jgi:hypothetical protein